jgi:hypothetical protein
VLIYYAMRLGYGDLTCYELSGVETPHVDCLPKMVCVSVMPTLSQQASTPSLTAFLRGEYPWRRNGTGIAGVMQV